MYQEQYVIVHKRSVMLSFRNFINGDSVRAESARIQKEVPKNRRFYVPEGSLEIPTRLDPLEPVAVCGCNYEGVSEGRSLDKQCVDWVLEALRAEGFRARVYHNATLCEWLFKQD